MSPKDVIILSPEILGGTPVFKGTDVPVKTLFETLRDNRTLEDYLQRFPAVDRRSVNSVLHQLLARFA